MTPSALYLVIALLGTLFYGIGCFAVWGDPGSIPFAHRLHQHWFNIAGAATGWIAGWPVFNEWFVLGLTPTFVTSALLLIAFAGITGLLPLALMTALQRKPANGRLWPPERP
jgi:hypothetical protein